MLLLAFLFSFSAWAVQDCPNCLTSYGPDQKGYEIKIKTIPAGQNMEEIKGVTILKDKKEIQELPVLADAQWFPEGHPHAIKKLDLNTDGYMDFALLTVNAINRYFDYYLYDSQTKKFVYLGNHPELQWDAQTKAWVTTLKDGPKSFHLTFQVKNSKLVEIKKERLN